MMWTDRETQRQTLGGVQEPLQIRGGRTTAARGTEDTRRTQHGPCKSLGYFLCIHVMIMYLGGFVGLLKVRVCIGGGVFDSFTCSWDPCLQTGLPYLALYDGLSSLIILCYSMCMVWFCVSTWHQARGIRKEGASTDEMRPWDPLVRHIINY